tara:strand:- start:295 stop:894 length:600 start_codon:yes stop_codon:yes gene_type:complete
MPVTVGEFTYGTKNIKTWVDGPNTSNLIIGKYSSIAHFCKIYLGGNHRTDWITTFPIFSVRNPSEVSYTNGDVVIGNDVWIAGNVTIMSGVNIGDGAVLANNSHVVKDVPPYAIVGGNPAQLIKYRFTPDQITKLLTIRWWEWDHNKVLENGKLLCSPDINDFIDIHYGEAKQLQDRIEYADAIKELDDLIEELDEMDN